MTNGRTGARGILQSADGGMTATMPAITPERAAFLGLTQGKALCPDCGAGGAIHEGYLNSPCPDCDGFLTIEIGVREKAYAESESDLEQARR